MTEARGPSGGMLRRLLPTSFFTSLWLPALLVHAGLLPAAPAIDWIVALSSFAALFIVPGLQLERVARNFGVVFHPLRNRAPHRRSWKTLARERLAKKGQAASYNLGSGLKNADALERALCVPARAFAFSMALLAISAAAAALTGLSVLAPTVFAAAVTAVLSLLPARGAPAAPQAPAAPPAGKQPPAYIAFFQPSDDRRGQTGAASAAALGRGERGPASGPRGGESAAAERRNRLLLAAFAASLVLLVLMSLGGENVARDRMWYMAYVTRLAGADGLDWAEPFLATGRTVPRFAYNAWLAGLAAWKYASQLPTDFIFQRAAPAVLSPLAACAALSLARSLFGPGAAALPALATLTVVLTSSFPFFGPVPAQFFARIAEDKTVALLVLMPAAIAVITEWLRTDAAVTAEPASRLAGVGRLAGLGLCAAACISVAASHAIVYLLLLIVTVPFGASLALLAPRVRPARLIAVFAVTALIAVPPAWLGWQARSTIVPAAGSPTVMSEQQRNPVVRSHERLNRLMEIGDSGPVVHPRLLYDPLLLLSLSGLALAAIRRKQAWAAFLLSSSLPCLALAFTPYLSPAFGRWVTPWMSYRALWGIPFGFLLAALLHEAPQLLGSHRVSRAAAGVMLAALTLAFCWNRVPWQRLSPSAWLQEHPTLHGDRELHGLLDEIASLPAGAVVAAGVGLAELIPAYCGHYTLAMSDRANVVFARSVEDAQARMRARAYLVALAGGSDRERDLTAARFGVTHTVYEDMDCDRGTTRLASVGRFSLCAEGSYGDAAPAWERIEARGPEAAGSLLASLDEGLKCTEPDQVDEVSGVRSWRRDARWSGVPVAVACSAHIPGGAQGARLRIVPRLPRATESIVFRLRSVAADGAVSRREGAVDFPDERAAEIELPAGQDLELRLAPAYLPYLNLSVLEIRTGGR